MSGFITAMFVCVCVWGGGGGEGVEGKIIFRWHNITVMYSLVYIPSYVSILTGHSY